MPYAAHVRGMVKQVIQTLRPTARNDAERVAMAVLARRSTRRGFNVAYRHLSPERKALVHDMFGLAVARCAPHKVQPGSWQAAFGGRHITVPIAGLNAPFLLDFGLAIEGHDIEVKRLYASLLQSELRPAVFYDIGANFGTHSVPFLVNGVRTVSVEPNPRCHDVFRMVCAANDVVPDLRPVALGDHRGTITLAFPPNETWLGTVRADVRTALEVGHTMHSISVPLRTVDSLVDDGTSAPDLIKIDTESSELTVLTGATATLNTARPIVVFESLDYDRAAVAELFERHAYDLQSMTAGVPLSAEEFGADAGTNFVACPHEKREALRRAMGHDSRGEQQR